MRILLTAYGPFKTITQNITEKIASDINKCWSRKDCELKVLTMPVEWASVESSLEYQLTCYRPHLVIAMGHADSYPTLTIETRYFNTAKGTDNAGEVRQNEIIKPDGANSYETNIDVLKLMAYLQEHQVPAMAHDGSEGMSYLCNFAGYIIAHHMQRANSQEAKFVFVHVPPPKNLSYDLCLSGIQKIIDFLS